MNRHTKISGMKQMITFCLASSPWPNRNLTIFEQKVAAFQSLPLSEGPSDDVSPSTRFFEQLVEL
jgi:hypothetical protein